MTPKIKLPLFWKFTIAIVVTIVIFGSINLYFLNYSVYSQFEAELSRHGIISGKELSESCIDYILFDDIGALNNIVNKKASIDPSIAFILIFNNKNKLIAHSFRTYPESWLLNANHLGAEHSMKIKTIKYGKDEDSFVMDFAVPILSGNLGYLRIGLYEDSYFDGVGNTFRRFLSIVLIFTLVGILGALVFSYVITNPINLIHRKAEKIDIDDFQVTDQFKEELLNSSSNRIKNVFKLTDEIDLLSYNFYTMLKRIENTYKELQQTQVSLFQSEKLASLGVLIAGISHEIRNPIAGLKNCIYRIKKYPDKIEQNTEYLEMMESAIDSLDVVVSRLLNFSKEHKMNFVALDMIELIEKVLLMVSFEIEHDNISIVKEIPPHPPQVYASGNHLQQVILNLIINSVDAINDRRLKEENVQGIIKISLSETDENVVLEIMDNGIGIPEGKEKLIFDPFFTYKKSQKGTGLGLSICYNIIKAHHGIIRMYRNQDAGITMAVSLPKWTES